MQNCNNNIKKVPHIVQTKIKKCATIIRYSDYFHSIQTKTRKGVVEYENYYLFLNKNKNIL